MAAHARVTAFFFESDFAQAIVKLLGRRVFSKHILLHMYEPSSGGVFPLNETFFSYACPRPRDIKFTKIPDPTA